MLVLVVLEIRVIEGDDVILIPDVNPGLRVRVTWLVIARVKFVRVAVLLRFPRVTEPCVS